MRIADVSYMRCQLYNHQIKSIVQIDRIAHRAIPWILRGILILKIVSDLCKGTKKKTIFKCIVNECPNPFPIHTLLKIFVLYYILFKYWFFVLFFLYDNDRDTVKKKKKKLFCSEFYFLLQ